MYKSIISVLVFAASFVVAAPAEGSDGFELEKRGGYSGRVCTSKLASECMLTVSI